MPALKPLDRPAGLGDQVYKTLRDYLGSHVIVPGQRLQEATLAVQLGVSRTPVREALARLESDGLIAADGRSFVVPVLSDADVDEIYELRALLEPAALAQVAESVADPRTLARIADALRAAEAADRNADADGFIDANARFHLAWHELVANRRLLRAIALYAGHVRYLRMLTLNNSAARKAALSRCAREMPSVHGASCASIWTSPAATSVSYSTTSGAKPPPRPRPRPRSGCSAAARTCRRPKGP
jgi:DNA-binding GntR family transcriptional regulator